MVEKKKRGLAAMSPERAAEIRRMGTEASTKTSGANFARNPELARRAGLKSAEARKLSRINLDPLTKKAK